MPTGSGKTAVLMMAPYILESNKTLIVTSSVMVRGQITEDFEDLRTLRKAGVFNDSISKPAVFELKHTYNEQVSEEIIKSDVVIATPQCALSLSECEDIRNKFDLVLVDESHHGNKGSLVYWLEFKNDDEIQTARFGGIGGGSALKFGIYKRKEDGKWITGNPKDMREIGLTEAIKIARRKRDLLAKGAEFIAAMADIFFTGVNALTLDGKLFNIDGNGSRVAPMLYGPDKVIVVAGRNKMTENLSEAIARTRNIAAPLDAKRLGKNTPCAKLGHCIDCHHPERICNDFVCIEGQFDENRIHEVPENKLF